MNGFKRRTLHVAVLTGLGAMGAAHAVHVNPKHQGSVLIYPYYTVRADGGGASTNYYDNYFSIVNASVSTKAVKVRFLEGKRGAEALSFNLYLSPFDVWTGGVIRTTTAGEGEEGAKLVSTDRSCVVPAAIFSTAATNTLNRFKNFSYSGVNDDGGGLGLDRGREGYLEVLEMGEITHSSAISAARHNSAGVPANCAYFETNEASLPVQMAPPNGGLYGALSLINVRSGSDFTYDAIALDQWSPATAQFTPAGSPGPSIAPEGASAGSTVLTADGAVTSAWPTPREAVSAAIMQSQVHNEWVLETATASGTDWVVTFPTKRLFVGAGIGSAPAPFNANFNNGVSCDVFTAAFYNREEGIPRVEVVIGPSELPIVPRQVNLFCYATNVLTFASSNMLGSTIAFNIDTTAVGRTGHLAMKFEELRQVLTPLASTVSGAPVAPQKHFGLPVVGFMIQDYANGNVGTPPVLSNYGGSFAHKYSGRIAP